MTPAPTEDLLRDPEAAWSPWRPTGADPWDASKAAHLRRRAGFGATWGQVVRDAEEGLEPSIRRMLDGDPRGPDGRPSAEFEGIVDAMVDSARRSPSIERVQYLWLFRMIFTPHPLAERMTLAWHGHYATGNQKVDDDARMLDQNLALRELWRARASRLHLRMLRDPAMLVWLDGVESSRERPNENLGREFLELFALGEGNYTEGDVKAAARALTGWRRQHGDGRGGVRFEPDEHDPGEKALFGATGPWGVEDVVRIATARPAAAHHLARRLYRTFVADTEDPPPGLLDPLAGAMRVDGDVDVARGIERVLRSRLFFSPWCRGKRVKGPVEFAVGALLACERFAPPFDPVDLEARLSRMGQRLLYPPTVAGWPGGLDWLRGPTLIARANFAAALGATGSEATRLASVARKYGLDAPGAWAGAFSTLVLGPTLPTPPGGGSADAGPPGLIVRDVLSLPEAQLS